MKTNCYERGTWHQQDSFFLPIVATIEDLYQSLKDRRVDGALIDSYTVGSRKELFSDGVLRMTKIISYSSAYGVVMAGQARKLQKCFREFLREERVSVFQIITDNIQGVTVIIIMVLYDENFPSLFYDCFPVTWCQRGRKQNETFENDLLSLWRQHFFVDRILPFQALFLFVSP